MNIMIMYNLHKCFEDKNKEYEKLRSKVTEKARFYFDECDWTVRDFIWPYILMKKTTIIHTHAKIII